MRLTILHTNDFHGRLLREDAEFLRQRKLAAAPNALLLDAGDQGASGNATYSRNGEATHDLMNHAGYDAAIPGNRDFHFSEPGFRAKLTRTRFPVLCANLRRKGQPPICSGEVPLAESNGADSATGFSNQVLARPDTDGLPTQAAVCFTHQSGARVAVFGVMVAMITDRMQAAHLSHWRFDQPIPTAVWMAAHLRTRWQPDLVIAVTHIGCRGDAELAEATGDIDLIIGGHSHTELPEALLVNDVRIVQAGCHARHIGVVEVNLEVPRGAARCWSSRLEPLCCR
ncbi:MAG: metallophosphoesterase [Armatimonadetes bacterium]|nr:metallophosphoesterase [Armatimonadota bacterium]MDE2205451.1 metallophosphoesterase [Armatimonadota bacterium]